MAYGSSLSVKDNFGRFQKQATINIEKALRKKATELQKNISEDIAVKLKEVYINNVTISFMEEGRRSRIGGDYSHKDSIFLENIDTVIEHEPGIGRDRVRVIFKNENASYPNGRTVKEIHEYLTEGTEGGSRKGNSGCYTYEDQNGDIKWAYNYPTPVHEFEAWTQLEMKAYLESLKNDIESGKYK